MKRLCAILTVLSLFLMTSCVMTPPPPRRSAILVVPARYTVVQIAFDMLRLRPVTLIAYDSDSDPESPVMHIWHRQSRQWLRMAKAEYDGGTGIGSMPYEVIVVGSELDLPAGLGDAPVWCENVRVIPTLRVMDLINELDKSFKFAPREWRWLAARHRLKIKDLNTARRRYGRYGSSGRDPGMPMPDEAEVVKPEAKAQETLIVPVSPIDDPNEPVPAVPIAVEPDKAPEDK